MGRPHEDVDGARSALVKLRVTPAQKARWLAVADDEGLDLSDLVRTTMDDRVWASEQSRRRAGGGQ